MPDLLLTLCVLLLLVFVERSGPRRWWLIMAVVAFAVLLKSTGWVLWLVLCVELVRHRWKEGTGRPSVVVLVCGILLPLVIGALLPKLLSRSLMPAGFWYVELFDPGAMADRAITNAVVYARAVASYFEQELPMWMNRIMVPLVLATAVIGFARRVGRRFRAAELLVMLWCLMLLAYPDTNSAARFMLPLLPVALVYLIEGSAWVLARMKLPTVALPVALGIFLLAHLLSVRWFAQHDNTAAMGPYAPAAEEAFEAVKRSVPADAVVASTRPWAVHLFTGRACSWALSPTDPGRPVPMATQREPAFVLLATSKLEAGMFDAGLVPHVLTDRAWAEVWRNDRFTLLQRQTLEQ